MGISIKMAELVKERWSQIITVIGGVFPTLDPDVVARHLCFDLICVGEGESGLVELCDRLSNNEDHKTVPGFWAHTNDGIVKNGNAPSHDLNELSHPKLEIFDERLLVKPMQGKLYKMVSIESSRGCPYKCTYCAVSKLNTFFKETTDSRYYRKVDMDRVLEQIKYQVDRHSPDFVYFTSETFLAISNADFEVFVDGYREIGLPFWFQTRFETINDKKIEQLKDIGLFWMTLGLEHGNEEYRAKYLERAYPNDLVIKGVEALKRNGIGASVNTLVGLPYENRELLFDTIKLCRDIYQLNKLMEINFFTFVPYRGNVLYDLCKKDGFLDESIEYYDDSSVISGKSLLKFTPEWHEELEGLIKTFKLYVELPEEYFPKIRIAERSSQEGTEMYTWLLSEFAQLKRAATKDIDGASNLVFDQDIRFDNKAVVHKKESQVSPRVLSV